MRRSSLTVTITTMQEYNNNLNIWINVCLSCQQIKVMELSFGYVQTMRMPAYLARVFRTFKKRYISRQLFTVTKWNFVDIWKWTTTL